MHRYTWFPFDQSDSSDIKALGFAALWLSDLLPYGSRSTGHIWLYFFCFQRPISECQEEVQWVYKWERKKTGRGEIINSVFPVVVVSILKEMNGMRSHRCIYQGDWVHIQGRDISKWQGPLALLNYMS
ncbi:hypothetical protein RND71_030657 [Anisodus tanguticus]|uniref:Uncharacterized protein n=1 Tax=Anisodus tanguticus TaxID=243964 RepID=A0AAE1RFM6_9SOLA|nr:hypothetical protein RND71_030657 [Anisodus tanguticus]